MAYGFRDETEIMRDIIIALRHPRFEGVDTIEAMRMLKRNRGETRV